MISEISGMGRWHIPGTKRKDLVEGKTFISVFELRPQHVLRRHFAFEDIPCSSGGHVFYRKYDPREKDFYLEMARRGPNNTQSTINFIETPCNFGGTRWWFECPGCQRRCAKLYEKRDDFYCRVCLDLEYFSHRINYHSIGELTAWRMQKLKNKEIRPEHSFYRGKMTRRAIQEEKLRWQVERGLEFSALRYRNG